MERMVQEVKGSYVVTIPRDWAKSQGISKGTMLQLDERSEGLMFRARRGKVALTLKTIGYEGRSVDDFVQVLEDSGVECLVDVRQLPLSRKKGFSKRGLEARLNAQGIRYRHIPELGAPKLIRDPFKAGGSYLSFEKAYRNHLASHQDALDLLKGISLTQPTAIMCVEAEPQQCHRGIVADELQRIGYTVTHIN